MKNKTKTQPQPKSRQKNYIEEKWEENSDCSLLCLEKDLLLDPHLYSTSHYKLSDKFWNPIQKLVI